jgi:chromosome segregation ATPase
MIDNDDIQSILKKGDEDKSALLEDILTAVKKAGTVFEKNRARADELKERSAAAEDDIVNLLNSHIRRLETEKIELSMEVADAREDLEQLDTLRARLRESETELEKAKAETESVLQEKNEANQKLEKIQKQWEKIIGS